MKLTVNNIDRNLRIELSQLCDIVDIDDNPDGVFLNWTTKSLKTFEQQTGIIEVCVNKKIPMIIFDMDEKITPEEASYLMSNSAFLWEPAVTGRNFFAFQPVWGNIKKFEEIPLIDVVGSIDLAYTSSLSKKIKTFKDYYQPISEIGDFRVAYIDMVGNEVINRKVEVMGIPVIINPVESVKSVILLGSEQDYQTGRLDPRLFEYLEAGIVPMLPKEHRWYHAIFNDLVVGAEDDTEYILRTLDKISFGCVYDVYRMLDDYLPECDVKNVAKRINNYFS